MIEFILCINIAILNKTKLIASSRVLILTLVEPRGRCFHRPDPLQPSFAYVYPLRTSENLKVFLCFPGV